MSVEKRNGEVLFTMLDYCIGLQKDEIPKLNESLQKIHVESN